MAHRSPHIHTFARKLDGKTGAAPLMYIYPKSLRGQSGMAPLRLTNAIWLVFPPFIAVSQTPNTHPDPWKASLKWKHQTWLSLMVFSTILDVNPDGICGIKMLHLYRCHRYLNTLVLLIIAHAWLYKPRRLDVLKQIEKTQFISHMFNLATQLIIYLKCKLRDYGI